MFVFFRGEVLNFHFEHDVFLFECIFGEPSCLDVLWVYLWIFFQGSQNLGGFGGELVTALSQEDCEGWFLHTHREGRSSNGNHGHGGCRKTKWTQTHLNSLHFRWGCRTCVSLHFKNLSLNVHLEKCVHKHPVMSSWNYTCLVYILSNFLGVRIATDICRFFFATKKKPATNWVVRHFLDVEYYSNII